MRGAGGCTCVSSGDEMQIEASFKCSCEFMFQLTDKWQAQVMHCKVSFDELMYTALYGTAHGLVWIPAKFYGSNGIDEMVASGTQHLWLVRTLTCDTIPCGIQAKVDLTINRPAYALVRVRPSSIWIGLHHWLGNLTFLSLLEWITATTPAS